MLSLSLRVPQSCLGGRYEKGLVMAGSPRVIILAALGCEVRPWIDAHRLKPVCHKPFDHYQSEFLDIIVTGIGAQSMATAVGWIGAQTAGPCVWLNLGIAGHATRDLGELFLVHGCASSEEGRAHYPPLVAKWSGCTDALLSVVKPSSDYPLGAAVDMEAAAFFAAANRFAPSELVQSVKVVSDNREIGVEQLNAKRISELMVPHREVIDEFVYQLQGIAESSIPLIGPKRFSEVRATVSQARQIDQLEQRLCTLNMERELDGLASQAELPAKALIRELTKISLAAIPQLAGSRCEGKQNG